MATKKGSTAGFEDPFFHTAQQAEEEVFELDDDELEIVEDSAPAAHQEVVLDDWDDDGGWEEEKTRVWQGGSAPKPSPAPASVAQRAPQPSGAPSHSGVQHEARLPASASSERGFDPMEEERTVITDSSVIGGTVEEHAPRARMTSGGRAAAAPTPSRDDSGNRTQLIMIALLLVAILFLGAAFAYIMGFGGASEPEPATLALLSDPAGAEVFVDGEPWLAPGTTSPARTPTTLRDLPLGRPFTVEARREGYRPSAEEVSLTEGERLQRRLELAPLVGTLRVETQPAGATVSLDGQEHGVSPLSVEDLRPEREYLVRAEREGYESSERRVRFDVDGDLEERLSLTLVPVLEEEEEEEESEPAARTARSRTPSSTPRATQRQEARTRDTQQQESDRQERREERRRAVRTTQRQEPPAAQQQQQAAQEPGSISVSARPYGQVWIDGRMVASETPLIGHSLAPGRYEVRVFFVDEGEFSETRRIEISSGGSERVSFRRR